MFSLTLSLFEQFTSPEFLGIPLAMVALCLPWLFCPAPSNRWLGNRMITLQGWFITRFTNQLFMPLKVSGHKWALLFMTLMTFLLVMNLMGLLPYTFTPTTQPELNLALALPLWLMTVVIGFRNQPTHALGHLLPEGTPTPLVPVLIIIESISLIIRPIALGVRLTANLTAGHLLIHLVSSGVFNILNTMPAIAFLTFILLLILILLEVAVAMIQAYVFVLLLSLYLQENI
uniref:ATP synthase F0 subunit 6 n=1 Tax=Gadomus arcuatus TaxID=1355534 RepID=UPI0028FCE28A|nr:ATP synthase F0 subunit 6 [Gadomus arcuatus]WNH37813.1 ATP synthase F0 subunit 6 [Gadomus arcuatus]